jgi:hypothetical protein
MAQKSDAEPNKQEETYLLEMDDETLKKVIVPAGCTVTFGALVPGSQSNAGKIGLRVWKGKQQLAVFVGVASFRAMSLKIEERVTTTKQETYRKGDGANAKAVVVEAQVHEWRDPDKPVEHKEAEQAGVRLLREARDD